MNLGVIGIGAGISIIIIGVLAIVISTDDLVFIRGMMLIITGVLIIGLSFRFKSIQKSSKR